MLTRRHFMRATSVAAGAAALLPRELFAAEAAGTVNAGATSLQDWAAVQRLFELDPEMVHAALFFIASHPRPVREAVEARRRAIDTNPAVMLESHLFEDPKDNLLLASQAALARYIGAQADEIALTNNTTGGLTLVYHGLPLKAGDEVLTTSHDHVVHHEAMRYATERAGATWRRVKLFEPHDASAITQASIVSTLRSSIAPATRALGITWVHSSSGLRMPIAAVAAMLKEVNASRPADQRVLLVVDGVHGLGNSDPRITETGVDLFVSGLHKWMLAPRGTGFVWARPEVWARMRPITPSFSAMDLYEAWQDEKPPAGPPTASWFSLGGFQAYEHIWGIPAAVELHEAIGPARVKARIAELNGATRDQLARIPFVRLRTPRDPALSSGITCFEVDGMKPEAVLKGLLARKVVASTSPYKITYARLSFGLANSEKDVDRAVAAVRALRS